MVGTGQNKGTVWRATISDPSHFTYSCNFVLHLDRTLYAIFYFCAQDGPILFSFFLFFCCYSIAIHMKYMANVEEKTKALAYFNIAPAAYAFAIGLTYF